MAARVDGDTSCDKYFDDVEYRLIIAQHGGYLNKKGQCPPGSMTYQASQSQSLNGPG